MKRYSCLREFSYYTFLGVLGTLGVSCYILADTFFIAKGLGTGGLAALNLAIPVYNFIHGTGMMLGMGGATRFAVCKSLGNQEDINKVYTTVICLAGLFSAIFLLSAFFCSTELALFLGADALVLEMTETYLRWLLIFSPAFILNGVLLCFVRNDEAPQLAMAAMLAGSFSNIVLDYIFIFPMQMGIFGAVFATGLSPVISIIMLLPHWVKKKNSFHLVSKGISGRLAGISLSLGFPSFVAQLSCGVVIIVFNTIILSLEGNTGVAAYGIVANISLVMAAIHTGIAQGAQPLISRFFGTKNSGQLSAVLRYAVTTALVFSAAIYIFVLAFSQPIVAVFNSESHVGLGAIAEAGIKVYFVSAPFAGYNTVLATYFTSIEKALPAHVLSLLRGLIFIIPAAFALSLVWGMTGVWIAYPAVEILVAVLGFAIYRKTARSIG